MTSLMGIRRQWILVLLLGAVSCWVMYSVTTGLLPRHTFCPRPVGTGTSSGLVLEVKDSELLVNDTWVRTHGLGDARDARDTRDTRDTVLVLRGRTQTLEHGAACETANVTLSLSHTALRKLTMVMKEAETALFPWRARRVRRVDCSRAMRGDPVELAKARHFDQQGALAAMPDSVVLTLARSCEAFKKTMVFISSPLSQQENDFPLAYSLLVFKDAEQVLNLLRAIYRPQNYYCIHVDAKSPGAFREAMSAMAACFPNVFLSSRSVDVQWGTFTVLEPELVCMRELWGRGRWRYFINLTGQEFPLRTNRELVQILTAYQGANNLEATRQRANKDLWSRVAPPPGAIIPTKGSVHVLVNRDFVDFVLHTTLGRDFLHWSQQIWVPDEVFFSTLNHNPHLGIRGTYTGEAETHPTNYPFLTRFKNWGSYPFSYPCSGKFVRQICILTSGDLPLLASRPELFANKFYATESRVALDCLAESIFNRTRDQFLGHVDFNVSYYASMPFVKNSVNISTFERDLL